MIPTYSISSSIDYLLRYAREARWDIVGKGYAGDGSWFYQEDE